jgi:hypothetical protein
MNPDHMLEPDRSLGLNWRTSADRAVTVSGDETGLHVLVADRKNAYKWRTAATLAEPGLDTDQWFGQACVTSSGRRAVVVYAPRQFVNREQLMDRGGFAAVVDLSTGAVTKLADGVSLAYYNPGCGAGETVVLSRLESSVTSAVTWLSLVDTAKAKQVWTTRTPGQVTSAIPLGGTLLAVKGDSLVQIARSGQIRLVARAAGTPFRMLADGSNGAAFQVDRGATVDFMRLAGGRISVVASTAVGAVKLRSGSGGRVFLVGERASRRLGGHLPVSWRIVDAAPDSDLSTTGGLAVLSAVTGREAAGRPVGTRDDGLADRVEITAKLADGKTLEFSAQPSVGAAGRRRSPALGGSSLTETPTLSTQADPDYSAVPSDPDRACAVPRNDPTIQAYQPTPQQAEWAADLAVHGLLTFTRPANWLNSGLPAFSPQGYFPSMSLIGGGSVPAQVLLGILAQESNMWQASFHAVDGSAGNPLTSSGFYGITASANPDPRQIDWSKVDCGYGAAQVTSGMSASDTGAAVNGVIMDYTKQKAVALDYATNIAAGLRNLQAKWNQTRTAGLIANNGDSRYIETLSTDRRGAHETDVSCRRSPRGCCGAAGTGGASAGG